MEMLRYANGVPSWVDHASPDPAAAAAFYVGLLGWDAPPGPAEMGGYRVCTLRGHPVAGIGPQLSPGPVAWASYINVDDAAASAARAEAEGAKVLAGPTAVDGEGRFAMLSDPLGALFGIWEPGRHLGASLVNEPGTLCWNELLTTDVEAEIAFYHSVFGWAAKRSADYTEFRLGERTIAGMMLKPDSVPAEVPPFWSVYFAVADLEEGLARAAELGGSVLMGPAQTPEGPFAVLRDPLGATFNLIAMVPASPKGAAGA